MAETFQQIATVLQSLLQRDILCIALMCLVTALICHRILKNTEAAIVINLSEMLHSGYGNVIFLMAGILWASSVSVLGTDIKNQVFTEQELSWETFTFFATVLIAIVIGVLHYVGQQRRERISQSRPPLKAIQMSSDHIIALKKVLSMCLFDWVTIDSKAKNNKVQDAELENLWRTLASAKKSCLQSLLHVAHAWDDGNNEGVVYSSNLFNVITSEFLLDELNKGITTVGPMPQNKGHTFNVLSVEKSPFFLFNDNWQAKIQRCDSLLVSEQNLSVSLAAARGQAPRCKEHPQSETPPICMPFSELTNGDEVKQPNLHGAPTARELKRPVYIADIRQELDAMLSKLMTTHQRYFSERFKQDLYNYYNADPTKSILSIPLFMYDIKHILSKESSDDHDAPDRHVVCIINVYSNKMNMFANHDMANSYCDLVKPICYVMSLLVSLTVKCVELQANLQGLSYNRENKHQIDAEETCRG